MSKKDCSLNAFYLLVLAFIFAPVVCAEPFWGSRVSQPVETDPNALKAGQFIWNGDAVASGSVVALVSIPKQRLYLYRHGALIGVSTVSTGKRGYGTPAGIFTVLEKDRHHRSRTYDNAPMPYANRLTWEGVALHAGHVMSYPASHGCIRLPSQFARLLFGISTPGMTVVIAGYESQTFKLAHPVVLLPMDDRQGAMVNMLDLTPNEEFHWQPENAQEGSVSIVMNKADQQLLVYRNGIEIGRAKISLPLTEEWGTHAFIMQAGSGSKAHDFLNHRWITMDSNEDNTRLNSAFFAQLNIPADFVKAVDSVLTPGSTLLITDKLKQNPQIRRDASAPLARCISGNCVDGSGTQIFVDGSKYVGEFKNGLSEGQGQLILSNGEKFVGKFKNDKFQWD